MKRRKQNPNLRRPHRIDWASPTVIRCCELALLGQSNKAIYRDTGLSNGMISYRLKYFEIKRMDYRDGTSVVAQKIGKVAGKVAREHLLYLLRTHAGEG